MIDFSNKPYNLFCGNSIEILKQLPDNSVDSIVTDPPYGLNKEPDMNEVLQHWMDGDDYKAKGGGFMGKTWDSFVPGPAIWKECMRVLKPGGHLLAFFGSRTYDMGTLAIRLAGFEVRDQIMWLYGSGFPKSLDVSKAIDKASGVEREIIGVKPGHEEFANRKTKGHMNFKDGSEGFDRPWMHDEEKRSRYHLATAPGTEAAKQWQGWGTALKPAHEPICVARKPFKGTVAANVLEHGTGALNIDGCRVEPTGERLGGGDENGKASKPEGWDRPWMHDQDRVAAHGAKVRANVDKATQLGRWPANVIHDGSEEVIAGFPRSSVTGKRSDSSKGANVEGTTWLPQNHQSTEYTDSGSAARFFYCAKASRLDRNEGLDDPVPQFKHGVTLRQVENAETRGNNHPTVKPTALMNYLIRLVTPPNGVVLDPFNGSGSTGKAAMLNDFKYIGIDLSQEYIEISEKRIQYAIDNKDAIIERMAGKETKKQESNVKAKNMTTDLTEQSKPTLNKFFSIEDSE